MELIFLPVQSAKKPYYLRSIDLSIYSLEEFCYFYGENRILLDATIMREEFEAWIEEELAFPVLSERLRRIREAKGTYIQYFKEILSACCLYTQEEKEQIQTDIDRFANKNESQKRKILGDQLFRREKYQSAIREYYALIHSKGFSEESDEFKGKVWHNLGCSYGMCFMFDEALECFKNAYSYSFSPETQNAVAFVSKVNLNEENPAEIQEDTFIHYLDYVAEEGRGSRYQQLAERMSDYRKGVEE